jgi:hypothetical protein
MKNQANSQLWQLKEQDNPGKSEIFEYFSNINAPNSDDIIIDGVIIRRIKLSQEELDQMRQEADEMGLPDSLDYLDE